MAKKDKKSKSAEQKARVAAKKTKKAAQKDRKTKLKSSDGSDAEDIDLESVLEEYSKQQARYLKVTETVCEPPSSRSSATIIGSPLGGELFLFGGEYFNGTVATFFNDLFIYQTERDEWRKVESPNSPLPRSGHAWCRGGNDGGIYLFGGEFSSPKQGTFYHYNDFWRLEPSSREWTRLESKGRGPPARSGHRMIYFKNYIILFGGFQDTSQSTKYLQDLWIYDCLAFVWHSAALPSISQRPDARSSFSFLPHDAGAVMCGGYSRTKCTVAAGRQTKGGSQPFRAVYKPIIHQDTWLLRITQPPADAAIETQPSVRWERRKKPANPPNPVRAGATMAYHKGRGILFGGVHDIEESDEGIDSEFFDVLYAWNIEKNRFYPLKLRQKKLASKRPADDRSLLKRDRGRADEAELLHNLASLNMNSSTVDLESNTLKKGSDGEEAVVKSAKPVLMTMPHPRFNTQLAVQGDVLYIFGGTYEHGDAEYTFDEMWAIDLGKLDGVKEIYRRDLEDWQGSEEEDSDSESEGELSEDEHDVDDPQGATLPLIETKHEPKAETLKEDSDGEADRVMIDTRPQPRPFENLRDFFTRTSGMWQRILLERLRQESQLKRPIKELRKDAFELADKHWWECREEVTVLEDEQEEAGIGEVVNIADRGNGVGSDSRRR